MYLNINKDGPARSSMKTPRRWVIPCIAVICLTTFISITYFLHSYGSLSLRDPFSYGSQVKRFDVEDEVITTNRRVPTSSRIPTNSRVPASSRIPTNSRVPTSSRIPTDSRVPTSSRIPTNSRVPASSRIPTNSRVPASSGIPTDSRVPTSSKIPTDSRVPTSSRIPTNRLEPSPVTLNGSTEIPTKVIFATHRLTESTNNVFFIETSCAKEPETYDRGGLKLTPPQACAIYSAAYHNPLKQVFLIYTCPLSNYFYFESSEVTKALMDLPNFSVVEANLSYIYSRSPLSSLFEGRLRQSQFPVEHNADILRILLVYLFGGTYMDLDVVSIKALDELGMDYIGAQQQDQLGTGVFHFKARHPYLKEILDETNRAYNPDAWAAAGPVLATSVLQKFCDLAKSTDLETIGHISSCGITVWSYKTFYPIRYMDWELYWRGYWPLVETMLNETYVVHVWNHMKALSSRDDVIRVGSNQPYAKLAEQNCAPVYINSGTMFRRR